MEQLAQLVNDTLALPTAWHPYVSAIVALVTAFGVAVFAAIYAGVFIFMERRIAGRMMSRIGPNRVGPQGIFQFVADAVKLIVKEDIIPTAADRTLFKLAPYLMFLAVVAGFAVLPLSTRLIGSDLNVGILYILAITSISVVGVMMSGWASNSKWALFGGMRSAAQLISYEIPSGLALLSGVLLAGSMSTQHIIAGQGALPWDWYFFHSPMTMALFVVFFIAQLAEGARIPFDLPEGESELVSGYNTEYSGFRFGAFFTAEFANTWIAAGLGVVVFFGGWRVPGMSPEAILATSGWQAVGWESLGAAIYLAKVACLVFLIIQLRWTIPRVRIDQMMDICWKYLLPITFVCIFLILAWMIVLPWESTGARVVRVGLFLMTLAGLAAYGWRVRYAIVTARERPFLRWII